MSAQDSTDPKSVTFVVEEAISGVGGHYDYGDDYYEDEEVEAEPEPEDDVDSNAEPISDVNSDGSGSQLSLNENDGIFISLL